MSDVVESIALIGIVFSIIRWMLVIWLNGLLSKAVAMTVKCGACEDFAGKATNDPKKTDQSLKYLKTTDPSVTELDLYQQYGLAIIMLY